MPEKFIHIGLSKTSSRTLQHFIFPKISEICSNKKKLIYYQNDKKLRGYYYNYFNSLVFDYKLKKINHKYDLIVSSDRLWTFRGDPYYVEEYAKKNLYFFGPNTKIIIFIRNPVDFLSSSYLQSCVYENNYIEPELFFLKKKYYSEKTSIPKFSIDDFSYKKLIKIYSNLFKKVFVVKFELIKKKDMSFFRKIFKNLDETKLEELNKIFQSKDYSYSLDNDMIQKLKLSKLYNFLDINETKLNDTLYTYDFMKLKDNYFSEYVSRKVILKKKIKNFQENLIAKRFSRIAISKKVIKYLSKSEEKTKKFKLDFKRLPQIDIKSLIKEYNNIPLFKIYKKN